MQLSLRSAPPVLCISAPTVHFVENGYRIHESRSGLAELGIPVERQIYTNLPDGELQYKIGLLASDIFRHAVRHGISQFVTFDADGFDKHPDHRAAHRATLRAARRLRDNGRAAGILAINSKGQGNLAVPVDSALKIRAAKHYGSQVKVVGNNNGGMVLAPRDSFIGYDEIFTRLETYDIVTP